MFKHSQYFWGTTASLVLLCLGYFPIRLAIAQQKAPDPEAILILGGGADREEFAAHIARGYPQLNIWVSSGSSEAGKIFREAGIPSSRLRFDCRATDTVTNFTTMVNDFKQLGIQHVYVITSDFHISRATAIATIVLGSQGITFTPVAVPGDRPPESKLRVARDVGRSLVWLTTGRTGASFKQRAQSCPTRSLV